MGLLERTIKPFIAGKIKQLLGVEEQAMIRLVYDHLKMGATPESMMQKVGGILDDDAEEFVFKLWQVLLFEQLKVEGGIYKK